jgi:hypothetical protein
MAIQPPLNLSNTTALGFHTRREATAEWACTWPIVLGELLEELEARFGPRDQTWTPLGIMFGGVDSRIRIHNWRAKQIIIRLSEDCASNCRKALFALAHEAVHLLAPVESATMLEEGLATDFSAEIGARFALGLKEASGAYIYARDRTAGFLKSYHPHVRTL